jgi:ribosomal protein S18 acetylase RimI-like enzyme
MFTVRIEAAQPHDLSRYIDFLEEVATWLEARGIEQWRPGNFRRASAFYAESIAAGEVQLAFVGDELAATLRVLLEERVVWPDMTADDGVYVHTFAVARAWASRGLGPRLLAWTESHAAALGRQWVRLDCMADNQFLQNYYAQAGFRERGDIDARFPEPVGTLRLRRYEKRVSDERVEARGAGS